jgi:RHS repeat-associated protein
MNVIRMQTFNYDCTPHFVHFAYRFTGKERDAESGLDYFGARYYGSSMGRFMSPDWATKPEAVPYSSLSDPQTLNLYGYMRNNPLGGTDKDGHCGQQQAGGTTCPNVTVTATPATQPAPLIHHSDYRSSGAILNRLWRHLVARVRGFSSARNHAMSGAHFPQLGSYTLWFVSKIFQTNRKGEPSMSRVAPGSNGLPQWFVHVGMERLFS